MLRVRLDTNLYSIKKWIEETSDLNEQPITMEDINLLFNKTSTLIGVDSLFTLLRTLSNVTEKDYVAFAVEDSDMYENRIAILLNGNYINLDLAVYSNRIIVFSEFPKVEEPNEQ